MKFFGPDRVTARQSNFWLLTFTDLIALLLAFFVMLFAAQQVETAKWSALVESLSKSLNPDDGDPDRARFADRNVDRRQARGAIDLGYLEVLLRAKVASSPVLHGVLIHKFEDRLVIALSADLLFPAGGARPSERARETLFALAGILRNIRNRMDIYGHTDPSTASTSPYRSNWELSIARALAVQEVLRRAGFHRELSALGYADTRFGNIKGSVPRDRAFALARRVDIVVHPVGEGR